MPHVLANTAEGFSYTLPEGFNSPTPELVRCILDEVKTGCERPLGRASLVSLLRGQMEEVSGYSIVNTETAIAEDEAAELEAAKLKTTEIVEQLANTQPIDLVATVEDSAVVVEEGGSMEPLDSTDASSQLNLQQEQPDLKDELTEEQKAAMKNFGINPEQIKGASSSEFKSAGQRRAYTHRQETMEKALKGQHKDLINLMIGAGFVFTYSEPSERWFSFEIPSAKGYNPELEGKRKNAYFDVSPLKNGGIGVSLYVDGKSATSRTKFDVDGYSVSLSGVARPKDWAAEKSLNQYFMEFIEGSIKPGGAYAQFMA